MDQIKTHSYIFYFFQFSTKIERLKELVIHE